VDGVAFVAITDSVLILIVYVLGQLVLVALRDGIIVCVALHFLQASHCNYTSNTSSVNGEHIEELSIFNLRMSSVPLGTGSEKLFVL